MLLEPLTPLPRAGRHRARARRCAQTEPLRNWVVCREVAVGLVPRDLARYLGIRGDRAVCYRHKMLLEEAIREAQRDG